jgi:hypothetical protein
MVTITAFCGLVLGGVVFAVLKNIGKATDSGDNKLITDLLPR